MLAAVGARAGGNDAPGSRLRIVIPLDGPKAERVPEPARVCRLIAGAPAHAGAPFRGVGPFVGWALSWGGAAADRESIGSRGCAGWPRVSGPAAAAAARRGAAPVRHVPDPLPCRSARARELAGPTPPPRRRGPPADRPSARCAAPVPYAGPLRTLPGLLAGRAGLRRAPPDRLRMRRDAGPPRSMPAPPTHPRRPPGRRRVPARPRQRSRGHLLPCAPMDARLGAGLGVRLGAGLGTWPCAGLGTWPGLRGRAPQDSRQRPDLGCVTRQLSRLGLCSAASPWRLRWHVFALSRGGGADVDRW